MARDSKWDTVLSEVVSEARDYFKYFEKGKKDEPVTEVVSNPLVQRYLNVESIDHDEPWLTLMALYTLFGADYTGGDAKNQSIAAKHLEVLLGQCGIKEPITVDCIERIRVEVVLPEIKSYNRYLAQMGEALLHPYPDRAAIIKRKTTSYEGNTNLDAYIQFISNEKRCCIFIEAKFLSDISYMTTYNPVRNQIIRNLDAMIDYQPLSIEEQKTTNEFIDLENKYFLLLTPELFKTESFRKVVSETMSRFNPQQSRLYCYVMDRYKNASEIKKDLPSRVKGVGATDSSAELLEDEDFDILAGNIGWISFEQMVELGEGQKHVTEAMRTFFDEREMLKLTQGNGYKANRTEGDSYEK